MSATPASQPSTVVRIETAPGTGYCINLDLVACAQFWTVGEEFRVDIRFTGAHQLELAGEAAHAFLQRYEQHRG